MSVKNQPDNQPLHLNIFSLDVIGKRFIIRRRKLNYGTYHLHFNASMYTRDEPYNGTIPKTHGALDGYFFIKPCALIAKIQGGNGRALGAQGELFVANIVIAYTP